MREVLFRGKRVDNGKWVYGSLVQWTTGASIVEVSKGHINKGGVEQAMSYPVDPDTVCQYTGLSDSDGRYIFEGDIIKNEEGYVLGGGQYCCRVKFESGQFMADDGFVKINCESFCYCTVVGNFYDGLAECH